MSRTVGKKAWGICDKTGFRYPLKDLLYEYKNGQKTGFRVGRDVWDEDHPQNFIGRVRTDDNQSLLDPRPDLRTDVGLFGLNPVGNPANYLTLHLGQVRVTVS